MTLQQVKTLITGVIKREFKLDLSSFEYEVGYAADQKFGDYYCNAAFVVARELKVSPRELAERWAKSLAQASAEFKSVTVAGPGFINITLTDSAIGQLADGAATTKPDTFHGQVVVTEYSDPNPFKVLHVGHLYTSVVGDAITNLVRAAGGEVHAVNFGGDVGLHVAKSMWAIIQELGGEEPSKLNHVKASERSEWMAARYVEGSTAYEDDEVAKSSIISLNKRLYAIIVEGDHTTPLAIIYWTCRSWSYDYFDAFYTRIGTKFEKYYPESENAPLGLATVRAQLAKGVYTESDGAVVFKGEPYGLHTRVFINSNGLPTYEAKDVGLIMAKWRDYHFDHSIVITGNDIAEYMKVVLKSLEQFEPELARRTTHITHGNVKLVGGVKMASRKGNFLRAVDVLDMATEANQAANGTADPQVVLGAVKYGFLKHRIGADLVFIPTESVSLEGNSGPYLQYAQARARSILVKAKMKPQLSGELEADERTLAAMIARYPSVVDEAVQTLMPHHICTYLYELAQVFNRFYEHNRVIDEPREATRLWLIACYADVLSDGLSLLGIAAPERI